MEEYNVAVEMTVHVEDMDKFDEVIDKLKSLNIDEAKIESIKEEDVGFGIKNIKLFVLTFDKEGTMDRIENKISEIPGTSLEITNVTRI